MSSPKASATDFLGRFREIVSDPLNLLIQKHPLAGFIEDDLVYLHNGHQVPYSGPHSYYGGFSNILVINRGVHEPLEEYVFQELLKVLPDDSTMIELGAYWGHYSMWLKQARPEASVCLVEPDIANLEVGCINFDRHGYDGEFIQAFVGKEGFSVDQYLHTHEIDHLTILHSDIQGYELEMLKDCSSSLSEKNIDYVLVSTHSQELHTKVIELLEKFGYRVEVSSDFKSETTSFDGFIFASSPNMKLVFDGFNPLGRLDIVSSLPAELIASLANRVS